MVDRVCRHVMVPSPPCENRRADRPLLGTVETCGVVDASGNFSRDSNVGGGLCWSMLAVTRRFAQPQRGGYWKRRCILGHAPIGEYFLRFNIDEPTKCPCGCAPIQTRRHILNNCSHSRFPYSQDWYLPTLIKFLKRYPLSFSSPPRTGVG